MKQLVSKARRILFNTCHETNKLTTCVVAATGKGGGANHGGVLIRPASRALTAECCLIPLQFPLGANDAFEAMM